MRVPLIVGFQGHSPNWDWLQRVAPVGVILFTRNLVDASQIQQLTAEIHQRLPGSFIVIDQEGGRVNRLKPILGDFPGPSQITDPKTAFSNGTIMGQMLASLGIDFNFAPVIDLDYGRAGNALDQRYLGTDPTRVAEKAVAYVQGLRQAGVEGCLKHFPGLGSTVPDSHYQLPQLELDENQWLNEEGLAYQLCAKMGLNQVPIMVGHCCIPFWQNQIATLSIHAQKVAQKLGHRGLLISDDFEMKALDQHQLPQLAVDSLTAGLDLVIVCHSADLIEDIANQIRATQGLVEAKTPRIQAFSERLIALKQKPIAFDKALADWQAFAADAVPEKAPHHEFLS